MTILKKYIALTSIFILLLSLSSCSKKIEFLTSPIVPAASGYVTIKNDKNKNYLLNIKISNLAKSTRLKPSKATYVVWIVDENNETKNIGQIQTSKLNASLETVSPFKPNKIFITAENVGTVEYPSDTILTTANF